MKVRVDGRVYRGRALEVHGVDPAAVARAVRGDPSPVAVDAPEPDAVFERVGVVTAESSASPRAVLAAAGRSLGIETPHDDDLAERRAELAAVEPPAVDRAVAKRRAAEAGDRERRLHERVARLRGRLRTLEERGAEADAAEARRRLREATAELSEVRTERIAAEERLDRQERRLRDARDRRERRLELRDRIDNLRRRAREHLADRLWDRFRAAVRAVPGNAAVGGEPGSYRGDGTTAALAALRVAGDGPAVVACGRFPGAAGAAECLGRAAIRVAGDRG